MKKLLTILPAMVLAMGIMCSCDKKSDEIERNDESLGTTTSVEEKKINVTEEKTENSESIDDDVSSLSCESELMDAVKKSSNYELANWVYADFDSNGEKEGFAAFNDKANMLKEIRFINSDGDITLMGEYENIFYVKDHEIDSDDTIVKGPSVVSQEDKTFVGFNWGVEETYWGTYIFGVKNNTAYELEISNNIRGFQQDAEGVYYFVPDIEDYGAVYSKEYLEYNKITQEFSFKKPKVEESLLLDYYWYNNIQSPKIYEFLDNGTVIEYDGDVNSSKSNWQESKRLKYKYNENELLIDIYDDNSYAAALEYVNKKAEIDWDTGLTFYDTIDENEYFFYEANFVKGKYFDGNAMYLLKAKTHKD